MTEARKKQRRVVGRIGLDGELHLLGDVEFVSSRLGPIVSRETEREHESEWHRVVDAAARHDESAER